MKKQIMLGGLLLLLGSCTPQNKANDPNAIDIAVSLEHLTELKTSNWENKSVISLWKQQTHP